MTKNTPPATGLEALAAEADNLGDTSQDTGATGPSQEEMNEAQAMCMIEASMAAVVFAGLKVTRSLIARKLPEIRDEWTDQALSDPATAAVPLLRKHMESIMNMVGSSPELAAFVMACIPLGLGVIAAIDKAEHNSARTVEAVPATANDAA